ncbi:hypothetical protein H0H93_004308 [Arthromyces matolae]|nr:hypothetical protein H0H93_004308 [Arthromyces matolae]
MGNPVEVLRLLTRLHDTPVNTEEMDTDELTFLYNHLLSAPSSSNGILHWFCHRATSDVVETAIFCIRMFAYESVAPWREKLSTCIGRCPDCVRSLEQAKVTSKKTYFGAYQDHVLSAFYETMGTWELQTVLEDLTKAGLWGDSAQSNQRTLADVEPAVSFRMVSNWTVFRDSRIQTIFKNRPPPGVLETWPRDPLPPGMLILLMDEKVEVRRWAESHASRTTVVPISNDDFTGVYLDVIEVIGRHLTDQSLDANQSFSFTTNLLDLWSGFRLVLRQIPIDILCSPPRPYCDFRGIVARHLYDTGPHFSQILLSFLLLIKRVGKRIWIGEGPEFPQVVFDAVKDNRSFSELLQTLTPSTDRPCFLAWFPEFLHSIDDVPIYKEVLAKIVDFLCEEAQHERFKEARPMIMLAGIRLLTSVVRKYRTEENFPHRHALQSTLDIHGETFLAVALARTYEPEAWQLARSTARSFALDILQADVDNVISAIQDVTASLAQTIRPSNEGNPTKFRDLSIRSAMWKKFYATIQNTDTDGIASMIALVAQSCHIDTLNTQHFSQIASSKSNNSSQTAGAVLTEVNSALGVFRDGFLQTINAFADYNTSSTTLDLLRRAGVIKNLMMISISPIEDLQVAAQVLVGLAFDVDGRQECFRALLENAPGEAFEGIMDFLTTFKRYAPVMPEACHLSKSLVQCFSDILDVLSATPNGLLHSTHFLNPNSDKGPAANLMNIWKLMTKSFTVILKRTPLWATYFDTQEMVVWMRDALIFGRDMLATWRVIEKAANSREPTAVHNSSQLSPLGKEMANGLQEVLLELTRWLRLTDEELLHQSFALLTSLMSCLRDAGLSPTDETMTRLRRFVNGAKKPDRVQSTTRLDRTRLLALEAALDDFEDVVEIVSAPAIAPAKAKERPRTADKGKEQRYVMTASKSKPVPGPSARSSSTSLKSQFFKDRDQQKTDGDLALPTFRRTSVVVPSRGSSSGLKFEGRPDPAKSESSSSESESDSENDSRSSGLAHLAKLQRSPKIKKPIERRQIKTLDIPLQKNIVRERLAHRDEIRNAAIRLNPPIGELYKTVLSWDYQHDGPYPPGPKADYVDIPDTFTTYDHYRKAWEPLLLLDIWAQIVSSKQEDHEVYAVKVNSRQFTDQWLDVDISFMGPIKKDWHLSETDLVILKHDGSTKVVMGKTMSYKNTPFGPQQGTQASVRCLAKNDPGLQMNTTWKLSKVLRQAIYQTSSNTSLNRHTSQREYASLIAVPYYDHFSTILTPRPLKLPNLKEKDIKEIIASYRVNQPQAKAILSSLSSEGFVLIQGPPGTGKTSTICSLIAASLSTQKPVILGGHSGPAIKASTKILLCAPSNAAIDEIASRLHSGKFGARPPGSIKVVRIGAAHSINASVQEISLDNLVDLKLANDPTTSGKSVDTSVEIASLQREIDALKSAKTQKEQEKENVQDNMARKQALMDEISQLRTRQTALIRELNRRRDENKSKMRDLDAKRRTFMVDVLQESDVICTTLSGAAHDLLGRFDFEMVIIDEAAQCVELSSLIPLKYRCNRCVMVGDPQQLPPTVISKEACKFKYNESLFVRLQKQMPDAVHLLSIQYRMHPEISCLPSRVFYQGRLLDGPGMDSKTEKPWHSNAKFGTYRFFNVANGVEELDNRKSLRNIAECQVAVSLYNRLVQEYSSIDFRYRVGVVSMYRAQIVEIRRAFQARFGAEILDSVDFNTVDGFQGQEKDIIILSCVRAGVASRAIGFLSDTRRMNVALTRAKSSLFILGNAPTLERSDDTWRSIVADARQRASLITADSSFFTSPTTVHTVPPPPTPKQMTPKVVPSTPVPLPSDLMTPRDFKAAHHVGSSRSQPPTTAMVTQPNSSSTNVVHADSPAKQPTIKDIPAEPAKVLGQKRLAETGERTTLPTGADAKIPRPPPTKRPKHTSMFIPKPNKKRPPDDQTGGPSRKQRLA